MIYCIFITPFLLFAFAEVCGLKKRYSKLFLVFLTIITILFIGLRYKTGGDWAGYIRIFESIHQNKTTTVEQGYVWLNRIIYYTFGNYFVLQFIATAFVCIVTYSFIKRYSEYPLFTFYIFLLSFFDTLFMSQIRQSLAVGIILLSTKFILNRKLFVFIFCIYIASLFHVSAVCAIPLYFLNRKINKTILVSLIFVSMLPMFFPKILFTVGEFLVSFLPISNRLARITKSYLAHSFFSQRGGINSGLYFIALFLLAVLIIILIKIKNEKMYFFLNAMVVYISIHNMATGMMILSRLECYYLVYGIIIYNYLFSLINFRKLHELFVLYLSIVLIFFMIPSIMLLTSNKPVEIMSDRTHHYRYFPYYNVLYHPYEAQYRKDWNE
jgi:hypothetical protein